MGKYRESEFSNFIVSVEKIANKMVIECVFIKNDKFLGKYTDKNPSESKQPKLEFAEESFRINYFYTLGIKQLPHLIGDLSNIAHMRRFLVFCLLLKGLVHSLIRT